MNKLAVQYNLDRRGSVINLLPQKRLNFNADCIFCLDFYNEVRMKFTVVYGSNDGALISIQEAKSAEELKKQIQEDNDGMAHFIDDVEEHSDTAYWPECSYLIIPGEPV